MLTNTSVLVGTNLAEIVTNAGIKLIPKNATLIQELVNAINNNSFKNSCISNDLYGSAIGITETTRTGKVYNESTHDVIMDNYIEDLSKIVANHISFSRNVVNKEVTKLKENIQKNVSSYKYVEAEDFFNISYFKLSDVFSSFIINTEISSYNTTSKFFFDSMNLAPITVDEFDLAGYILTGDPDQDAYISEWFAGIGKEKAIGYLLNTNKEYSMGIDEALNYAFINYMFYRNLVNKTDLSLGYSLQQLKSKASGNRDYFGNKVNALISQYKKDVEYGRVLTTTSNTAFSYMNSNPLNITIYEENFVKLTDAGISLEVLFGFISKNGDNSVSVDELIAGKEKYLDSWNVVRSLYITSMAKNKLNIVKQILRVCFDESMLEVTEEEKEVYGNNSNHGIADTREIVGKYIDDLMLGDIDDIDTICLDIVAKYRFRFSNAYFILKEMSDILKLSDNINPMEAGLYAVIKYITDFSLGQIDTVKVA